MRRHSAGYVKTLEEAEEGSRRSSWKRLFASKKAPRATGSSAKPLLLSSVPSSSDSDPPESSVTSEQRTPPEPRAPSRTSIPPPEQRPEEPPQPQPPKVHNKNKTTTTPQPRPPPEQPEQQQQQPTIETQVIQGVKQKLKSSSSPSSKTTTTSSSTKKQQQQQHVVLDQKKVQAALSRPFGHLPPHLASNWVVEVSPAEWDAQEERWKYRILVQKRSLNELDDSMTTAFCWRSLADFLWLEQALRAEYHGALLLPLLSIAIGTPDVANFTQQDVDSTLLKEWLNSVLNGIRGHGELVLNQAPVDLVASEAMEAFLYRNASPLASSPGRSVGSPPRSPLDRSPETNNKQEESLSFVDSLLVKPFSCLNPPLDGMCGGVASTLPPTAVSTSQRQVQVPLHLMACSSRALGDAHSFNVQDSFADFEPEQGPLQSSSLAIHSEVLEAERELVSCYRQASMSAMDKGRLLIEEETHISVAWKRFAISISALFSYEKENESLRVEETRPRKRPTYRKLNTENVEELLRLLTKQKTERTVPSLRGLDSMLSAYVGDLSAVNPSLKAYSDAVLQLSRFQEETPQQDASVTAESNKQRSVGSSSSTSWNQLKTLANSTVNDVKKQIAGESINTETTSSTTTSEGGGEVQKRAFEARVLGNERLLRDSVTALCRGTPVRVSRMAWQFFNKELTQAGLLKSCAYSMRTKVNIIDRDALARMIERHKKESMEDAKAELDLVQRIITIEDYKKVTTTGANDSDGDGADEDGFKDDKKQALLRSEAMELVKARVGRWDSKVGLAIMKAVGAEEGEVRVDETTRELRIVRKFAIGLREQLERCTEALNVLKGVVFYGDPDALIETEDAEPPPTKTYYLRDARRQFVDDITDVFSCSLVTGPDTNNMRKSASTSMGVLARAGIELDDPAGWSSAVIPASKAQSKRKIVPRKRRGRCGELTVAYTDLRNAQTEKLLETLSELLESYKQRLESIESYVYMQCVGIQLEKHFSQQRSEALAAFEKKTDITTAISIAQRKKLPLLVSELEAKMSAVSNVTHTDVKKLKEIHLVSKNLKAELTALATRRFVRLRETCTERVIGLLTVWAQHEEEATNAEIKALGEVMAEVERQFANVDFTSDGISHAFFGRSGRKKKG